MSEQEFLDQLKQLKIQIEEATETARELATRTVVEQEDEIKQDCFLNMFGDLNNKVESIELMIEQIESQTYSLEDRML
jgi:chaperonin cofactor prefoldin